MYFSVVSVSSHPAVADVGRQWGMQNLGGLEIELGDTVEDPLAGPEQKGGDVEPELVDHAREQRLADGRGAARDVDAVCAGSLAGLGVGGGEATRAEVKR